MGQNIEPNYENVMANILAIDKIPSRIDPEVTEVKLSMYDSMLPVEVYKNENKNI